MAKVLVSGRPGSGKTTLASRVVHILREHGEAMSGSTTREIRRGGRRTGFTITGVNGLELGTTLVVDEIGKMELLSSRFRDLEPRIFAADRVLATVHAHADPLTDALKHRPDVRTIELPHPRPVELASTIASWLLNGAEASSTNDLASGYSSR